MTTRRTVLKSALGTGAFASLLQRDGIASIGTTHSTPKAKRVVYLFQSGGPSHLELLDEKPELRRLHGSELPESIRQGQRLTGMTSGQSSFPVIAPKFRFHSCGQSGTRISSLLPHTGSVVDDICIVKSMFTEAINHDPAITFIQTGSQQPGRPSLGAWASYGLGSEAEDLPAFLVLISHGSGKDSNQGLLERLWGSGFLPSSHQGVKLRSEGDPVLYLSDPKGIDRGLRRQMLDSIAKLNNEQLAKSGDPEISTRIAQYEMAFRMQSSVPELTDLTHETDATFRMYGDDARKPGTFAANCLLTRRLFERCALCAVVSSRLGQSWWPADKHTETMHGHRSGSGGSDHGSEATRNARRYAHHLGRRIWPHGLRTGRLEGRLRTRPPRSLFFNVAGWWRDQAGHDVRSNG